MMYPSDHHTARRILLGVLLISAIILRLAPGPALAAAIGDQVELKATHHAGVPFHHIPGGGNDFQRIPDGTRAHVVNLAKDGQWLALSVADGRTGWVTSRYVRSIPTGRSSPDVSPAAKKPRVEAGTVTHVADGDTITVVTANQTKLRIRMLGIDAPETPKGAKFSGQPYGAEAEAYLKQLIGGKRVTVEIYGVESRNRLLATVFLDGKDMNLAMIEAGLAEVYRGPDADNPYRRQYQTAENTARSSKKNMWIQGQTYESPRAYRKRVGIS